MAAWSRRRQARDGFFTTETIPPPQSMARARSPTSSAKYARHRPTRPSDRRGVPRICDRPVLCHRRSASDEHAGRLCGADVLEGVGMAGMRPATPSGRPTHQADCALKMPYNVRCLASRRRSRRSPTTAHMAAERRRNTEVRDSRQGARDSDARARHRRQLHLRRRACPARAFREAAQTWGHADATSALRELARAHLAGNHGRSGGPSMFSARC